MYMPNIPIWCWNMLGPDTVRLSQPTVYWSGGTTRMFPVKGPCAARCEFESWVEEPDRSVRSHPFQCGRLAMLWREGAYLCALHTGEDLGCAWCDDLRAAGSTKACPGCHVTWKEAGLPDWCCPEGTSLTEDPAGTPGGTD